MVVAEFILISELPLPIYAIEEKSLIFRFKILIGFNSTSKDGIYKVPVNIPNFLLIYQTSYPT